MLVQALVVDKLGLGSLNKPYIYVLFILMLPVGMKPWKVLLIAGFTGLVMDTFSYTPGMHMAACVLMGYLRGFYLQFSTGKDEMDANIVPNVSNKGWVWFTLYCLVLISFHHTLLFYLEIFGLHEFFQTFIRVLLSTLFSTFIILLSQLLFYKISSRNG